MPNKHEIIPTQQPALPTWAEQKRIAMLIAKQSSRQFVMLIIRNAIRSLRSYRPKKPVLGILASPAFYHLRGKKGISDGQNQGLS